jgi:hypothetical protein
MSTSRIINGPMSINLGTSSWGDIYYAGLNGQLKRLPIGIFGDILRNNDGTPGWITPDDAYSFTSTNVATYSILATDQHVGSSYSTTGASDVTLPSVTSTIQKVAIIDTGYNAGVNNITINSAGADTVQGGSSIVMNQDGMTIEVISDGVSAWHVV